MTYRFAPIAVLAVALVGLAACHPLQHLRNSGGACHEVKPYMRAASIAPLKIPPGLDSPDTANALHVPAVTAPVAPERKKTDPCLDQPPPFNVPKQAPPQA
jgi:uncharacterized lipoprotein